MTRLIAGLLLSLVTLACSACDATVKPPADRAPVRVAVIGGMTMTGLWQEVSDLFKARTGYDVQVVVTGPRPGLADAMRAGRVDLLTMHSGDITTNLVAEGYAVNMRPWTRNDLVIVGPAGDPAGIRGLHDGAEALRRIAAARANLVDFQGIGSREVMHGLWARAGLRPGGEWLIRDESSGHLDTLRFAAARNAYVVVGRMPVLFDKLKADGMEILVDGDPAMRRPYMVMQANPQRFPHANAAGARALADFLLSDAVQTHLARSASNRRSDVPLFHPVNGPAAQGRL